MGFPALARDHASVPLVNLIILYYVAAHALAARAARSSRRAAATGPTRLS